MVRAVVGADMGGWEQGGLGGVVAGTWAESGACGMQSVGVDGGGVAWWGIAGFQKRR